MFVKYTPAKPRVRSCACMNSTTSAKLLELPAKIMALCVAAAPIIPPRAPQATVIADQ